jgi:drug/metabolite transporter (DMT)-like permease
VYGSIWGAWYLLLRDDVSLTAYSVVVPLVSGALGIVGTILFLEALARGNVSVIGTLVAAYPCVTVIVAFFLLDERLSATRYAGVGLIILGIVVLSISRSSSLPSASRLGLFLATLSFLAFGLMGVAAKEGVRVVGNDNSMGFYALVYLPVGISYWAIKRKGHPEQSLARMPRKAIGIGAVGLVFGAIGGILLIWAMVDGPASIVVALSGAYPIVTIAVALTFLKERVVMRQALGLLSVLAGLPLVSL